MPQKSKIKVLAGAVILALLLLIWKSAFVGFLIMGAAIVVLFFLPWLDKSPVKSMRYRPSWHKGLLICFVINFLILGYLGVKPPSPVGGFVAQVGTLIYFGFFLLMPWWTSVGEFKQPPERVTFKPH